MNAENISGMLILSLYCAMPASSTGFCEGDIFERVLRGTCKGAGNEPKLEQDGIIVYLY